MNARSPSSPLVSTISGSAPRAAASRWLFAGLFASLLGAAGCQARATTAASVQVEEPVMEVATVPVAIETYPRHAYQGRYVYLVDGRWYYRARGRWVVYTAEPVALARVRVGFEASARAHGRSHPEIASPRPQVKGRHHPHKH